MTCISGANTDQPCTRKAVARGLCRSHYDEMVELGRFGRKIPCGGADCLKYAVTRGFCRNHYKEALRAGSALGAYVKRGKPRKCSERDCTEPARAKGKCNKHYLRQYRGLL